MDQMVYNYFGLHAGSCVPASLIRSSNQATTRATASDDVADAPNVVACARLGYPSRKGGQITTPSPCLKKGGGANLPFFRRPASGPQRHPQTMNTLTTPGV